ncbi:MAG: (Fe-S)-binding protein [Planctomycetaceae bacterium]|nr:(Fe-S)-binding protein [Planctomycetaceae bacterium]
MIEALTKNVPHWEYPQYKRGDTVALFTTCFIDQFFPSAARAVVQLLEEQNVPVEFPPEQTCCGQPALNSGYRDDAISVMNQFGRVFEKYRWVVTPSASCAAMCRIFFQDLAPESAAAKVGLRVYEITEFLVNVLGITDTGAAFPHKVAMHIGCHGRRELGIAEPAMKLLHSIRGLDYHEIPNIEECCGFGGTFSVKMAGTSLAMGRKKVANIRAAGADVVATTDLSCAMHFGGIMRLDPTMKSIPVMHLAEILVNR